MKDSTSLPPRPSAEDDLDFAHAVLPLLLESAELAGYRGAEMAGRARCIEVHLRDAHGGELCVYLGRAKKRHHAPNRRKWVIANRPTWRRTFCALQDRLFGGRGVPGWLRPGCTSCGRVQP
ncbi:hypothetical protein ACERK3_19575 [Phycisphaerales bacterium AB-hyl4]|uniref:Uncharacterized protein n=1 Tax=Natronomicrosphaera hydrolytica TaxID=3242702 RepID=A0ABV4UCU0_9BACT